LDGWLVLHYKFLLLGTFKVADIIPISAFEAMFINPKDCSR
jgi:hypothetical protein